MGRDDSPADEWLAYLLSGIGAIIFFYKRIRQVANKRADLYTVTPGISSDISLTWYKS